MEPQRDLGSATKPRIRRLLDLPDYQNGSIVSTTMIDRKNGSVTFFAFDKGQRLSEHKAPYAALIHVLEGESEIMVSGKTFSVKQGEFITIPAKQPHSLTAVKRFKMLLTMIR